ncbi:hypothetical protein G7Y89_g11187 [Cudoniella acicularis]|uniref:FAD-binding domain-containing protein n=1 Tax=Cudoniella acicularis TaxID=354080 RepID=A0A8H4W0V9_9HELO|nr:hypothetical protein G7Y89_g11187 [Cudoniella acicularis]
MIGLLANRAQFGLILPSTNTSVEAEFNRIKGVSWHSSRIFSANPDLSSSEAMVAFLEELRVQIKTAVQSVCHAKVDFLVMGMSAETFWGGKTGAEEFVKFMGTLSGGLRVTTGAAACAAAGTNLLAGKAAAELEKELGKPVIAINTATVWHAYRSNGILDKVEGWGRVRLPATDGNPKAHFFTITIKEPQKLNEAITYGSANKPREMLGDSSNLRPFVDFSKTIIMDRVAPPPRIAIIGSGIGGLALAIGLLAQNTPCTVFEGAPRFDAIGAGIGMGPNALKAMELMSSKFARLYDEIKVGNTSPEKVHEQFEILGAEEGFGVERGWRGGSVGNERFERSSAHRRALLEVMRNLIPEGTVRFGKRVVGIAQLGGEVELRFEDGEVVVADVVVGCDGIKGMTRKVVLQSRFPEEVAAKYTNTYAYRGIAPMEEAKEIVGDYAKDAKWFMMEKRGWAMYPISKGEEVNIVAFIYDENPWMGEQAAREVSREEMLSEFEEFDRRLFKLLDYVKPMKWPLFHHPDTPTYYNGRICLLGDSAHASSPSQAAAPAKASKTPSSSPNSSDSSPKPVNSTQQFKSTIRSEDLVHKKS